MPEFGLIGHPIEHSQSPRLFEAAYHGKYSYDLIRGEYFEESYSKFLKGYKAINVTAPFKEKAYEKADIVSGPVALTGAANILVKTPEGVSAYNSDFTGVILTVAEALFPGIIREFYSTFGANAHVKVHQFVRAQLAERFGRKPAALVAGLGGAGKAAALAAAEMGFDTTVMNRTASKTEAFVKGLPEYGFRVADISSFKEELHRIDLLVYALPMALDCFSELTGEDFAGKPVVLEANYRNPAFSGLLRARMMDAGANYLPGNLWLVNQAVSGYSVMTGEAPDIDALIQ
jgi:shikimate 5-dehydrogenase